MSETSIEETPELAPTGGQVEAAVWRLGPSGILLTSVLERHAGWLAEQEPNVIYFYASLDGSTELKNTDETMSKVFTALSNVGLSEAQIIKAVNGMQASGILFREPAH